MIPKLFPDTNINPLLINVSSTVYDILFSERGKIFNITNFLKNCDLRISLKYTQIIFCFFLRYQIIKDKEEYKEIFLDCLEGKRKFIVYRKDNRIRIYIE